MWCDGALPQGTGKPVECDGVHMQLGGSALDTGANYAWAATNLGGAGTNLYTETGLGPTSVISTDVFGIPAASALAGLFGLLTVDIFDYADTSQWRVTRSQIVSRHTSSSSDVRSINGSGWWKNTTDAVERISLTPWSGSNFVAGTKVQLYGVG